MLLPAIIVPGSASETAETGGGFSVGGLFGGTDALSAALSAVGVTTDDGVTTILAASDFQAYGSSYQEANSTAAANFATILAQVTRHHSIEAFLFGGDYNSVVYGDHADAVFHSTEGYNLLADTLAKNGLGEIKQYFVQGNHDPAGLSFVTPTGGYDEADYGV